MLDPGSWNVGCLGGELDMSYRDLEIWQLARDLVIEIHEMTLNNLPKFEMFEEGRQIRKSSKSVEVNYSRGLWQTQIQTGIHSIPDICHRIK